MPLPSLLGHPKQSSLFKNKIASRHRHVFGVAMKAGGKIPLHRTADAATVTVLPVEGADEAVDPEDAGLKAFANALKDGIRKAHASAADKSKSAAVNFLCFAASTSPGAVGTSGISAALNIVSNNTGKDVKDLFERYEVARESYDLAMMIALLSKCSVLLPSAGDFGQSRRTLACMLTSRFNAD